MENYEGWIYFVLGTREYNLRRSDQELLRLKEKCLHTNWSKISWFVFFSDDLHLQIIESISSKASREFIKLVVIFF